MFDAPSRKEGIDDGVFQSNFREDPFFAERCYVSGRNVQRFHTIERDPLKMIMQFTAGAIYIGKRFSRWQGNEDNGTGGRAMSPWIVTMLMTDRRAHS